MSSTRNEQDISTLNFSNKIDSLKVCLVGSSGGHLAHLHMLEPFWKDKNRFWVTFDKEDARSVLEGESDFILAIILQTGILKI